MGNYKIYVSSFGFKYGCPEGLNDVIDVRFLSNPYYDENLRPLTGKDRAIGEYLENFELTESFLNNYFSLLDLMIPGYIEHGKEELYLGVGCTGGRHRSVYCAERIYSYLLGKGYNVEITHRDIKKDAEK